MECLEGSNIQKEQLYVSCWYIIFLFYCICLLQCNACFIFKADIHFNAQQISLITFLLVPHYFQSLLSLMRNIWETASVHLERYLCSSIIYYSSNECYLYVSNQLIILLITQPDYSCLILNAATPLTGIIGVSSPQDFGKITLWGRGIYAINVL